MNLFKKKEKDSEDKVVNIEYTPLKKILESASLEPLPYRHSEKFIKDGEDPLSFERERISHKNVDYLLMEQRIPAIEADTKLEIENGKKQYSDHIYACRKIYDLESGELQHILDMRDTVNKEIEEYFRLEQELISNSKSVN